MAGTRHTRKPTRKESCVGKHKHLSETSAKRSRWRRITLQGAAEWTCNTYQCRFCCFWHVGHRPAPKFTARARR
jgi:hypothetical protein